MNTEKYYIIRDSVLRDVEAACNVMDNETIDNINRLTIDIMSELNKWRKKNDLGILTSTQVNFPLGEMKNERKTK